MWSFKILFFSVTLIFINLTQGKRAKNASRFKSVYEKVEPKDEITISNVLNEDRIELESQSLSSSSSKSSKDPTIVGGYSINDITARYMAYIVFSTTRMSSIFCNGIFISRSRILSSADCYYGQEIIKMEVIGANKYTNFFNSTSRYQVRSLHLHRKFVFSTMRNNLAIITLEGATNARIGIATIPSEQLEAKEVVYAAAYGYEKEDIEHGSTLPRFLQEIELQVRETRKCLANVLGDVEAKRGYSFNTHICATLKNFETKERGGMCDNDSGASLYTRAENGANVVLQGILAISERGCVKKGNMMWFTKILHFKDDIEMHKSALDVNLIPSSVWKQQKVSK